MFSKQFIWAFALLALIGFSSAFIGVGTTNQTMGTIQFVGNAGQETVFTVEQWAFTNLTLDPANIENLHVELEMNLSSMNAGWKELLESIKKKKDYFYVKKFPKATVVIDKATKVKDNEYTCTAMLTLKNITKPVILTFTIEGDNELKIKGNGVIIRQDFNFTGGGPKNEIPVMFDLVVPKK